MANSMDWSGEIGALRIINITQTDGDKPSAASTHNARISPVSADSMGESPARRGPNPRDPQENIQPSTDGEQEM
ncbi:MAG: hypothetical protein GX594_15100 [Pirellulaceae bacterium]|nr:hypothetical protein [Pirellulaceae bacterium]